ncbi:zinc-binding dehydrogenase [Nocardia sp. PE-7]|nr:zinc-binding dehydrogenase [Nocardia sp. PE-7]WKG11021.1 zinc-binding dehydrogenase [Nocardia sp. PE-7]
MTSLATEKASITNRAIVALAVAVRRRLGRAGAAARPCRRGLRSGGLGVIGGLVELTGGPQAVVSIADLDAPKLGVRFSGVARSVPDALVEAAALIAQGKLRIPVEKSYPLSEAAAAHVDSQAGHSRGRRVVVV